MNDKKLHIGKLVEQAFNQSGIKKAQFARAIDSYASNLKRDFEKEDWSVIKLIKAGRALNYDFSSLFDIGEKPKNKPKVLLQIEIDEEKVNDILKVIKKDELYNLIKKE